MSEWIYNLYHYRGPLVATYETPIAAQEAKESQKNPSEYYWEMAPKDPKDPKATFGALGAQ